MKTRCAVIGLFLSTLVAFAQERTIPQPFGSPKAADVVNAPSASSWTNVGDIVDPDRDSSFTFTADSLVINVPGAERPHDFAPELKVYNAPRVLNPVKGDFSMSVKIDGKFSPGDQSTLPGRTGYTGAGLILIGDRDNCITLARATLQRPGSGPLGYINFEMRSRGELVRIGTVTDRPITSDAPIYLRLERKENQVLGAVSEDGKRWEPLPPKNLPESWPQNGNAGVVAISTSTQAFSPKFSEFRRDLERPQKPLEQSESHRWNSSARPFYGLSLDEVRKKLPEQITPISKEHLASKVPHFYYFEYRGFPQPGKRYWLRVDDDTWVERYPDGFQSTFKVLGHAKVGDTEGTLVVKVSGQFEKTATTNDGGLQAFIPDKGSTRMHHWYRNSSRGDTEWNDLAPMKAVE